MLSVEIPTNELATQLQNVPFKDRSEWVTKLAEALRDNDPSHSFYAAQLLARTRRKHV